MWIWEKKNFFKGLNDIYDFVGEATPEILKIKVSRVIIYKLQMLQVTSFKLKMLQVLS